MATVYKLKVVSTWVNYRPEELKRMLEEAIKNYEMENGISNEVRVSDVVRK